MSGLGWRRCTSIGATRCSRTASPADALPIYSNVVTPDWQVPTGQLYTVAGIKPGADIARQVIAALPDMYRR